MWSTIRSIAARAARPLASRKVRVAIATAVTAYVAEFGLQLPEAIVYAVVAAGCSVILGIGIEDAGAKSAGK